VLDQTIALGRVLGIRVGLHYTWFLIFALISFSLASHFQVQYPDWSSVSAWATAIITALLFFASILLHEFGHSVIALAYGVPVRSITLFVFGGVAQTERDAPSARAEFSIAIAGPAVSLLLAALFYVLHRIAGGGDGQAATALDWLASINLAVAIFNLLPGFPLDGGRVFRAIMWGATGSATKGMRWAVASGRTVAYGMMLFGLYLALGRGAVVDGIWLALIGWFLLSAAESSARQFALGHATNVAHARNIMRTDVPRVAAQTTVQDWIEHDVLTRGERAFLVEDSGQVTGLVSLSDAGRLPREQWPLTPVWRIMTPAQALDAVGPDAPLGRIIQVMETRNRNQVLVRDGAQLLGWIDRDRLVRAMRVFTEINR